MNTKTDINSYDYYLPSELIATSPAHPKQDARLLLYVRKTKTIEHLKFKDLPDIVPQNTAIIFNDTKVIKARIFGKKLSGGASQIMLNQPLSQNSYSCYIKGKVTQGSKIVLENGAIANVLNVFDDGLREVSFEKDGQILSIQEILQLTQEIGQIPLPPYIKRAANENDESWYQSIFAKNYGAVAAPTASLHFDNELKEKLAQNHQLAYITLHVGAGTFKGVEQDDITKHIMHKESYEIPKQTASLIDSKIPLLGVGTTVTRTIEYYARHKKLQGECDLFLNPTNPPIRQDFLLTNFHLPKSTLIMLVASFVGIEQTQRIYQQAIEKKYKFYSYGDGMMVI